MDLKVGDIVFYSANCCEGTNPCTPCICNTVCIIDKIVPTYGIYIKALDGPGWCRAELHDLTLIDSKVAKELFF